MIVKQRQVFFVLSVLLAAQSAIAIAAPACPATVADLNAALEAGDIERLKTIYHQSEAFPACETLDRERAANAVAAGLMNEAAKAGRPSRQRSLLREAQSFIPRWDVVAKLGEVDLREKKYESATKKFLNALEMIDSNYPNPQRPQQNEIDGILNKLSQAKLLSKTYIAGMPSRGIAVSRIALPITFEFDSTEFTGKGKAAAADLLAFLKERDAASVVLVGHTDPTGNDKYNLDLSQQRADAVRNYISKRGFKGSVTTVGRGEREPFSVDDPKIYSQQELYQLYRRVEVQIK
jgi:OOP family OmpA-OmpF porin